MTTVRADVEQELRADELREILAQQQQQLNSLKETIHDAGREIDKEASAIRQAGQQLTEEVSGTADQQSTPDSAATSAHQTAIGTETDKRQS